MDFSPSSSLGKLSELASCLRKVTRGELQISEEQIDRLTPLEMRVSAERLRQSHEMSSFTFGSFIVIAGFFERSADALDLLQGALDESLKGSRKPSTQNLQRDSRKFAGGDHFGVLPLSLLHAWLENLKFPPSRAVDGNSSSTGGLVYRQRTKKH